MTVGGEVVTFLLEAFVAVEAKKKQCVVMNI